jgi:hypothetical protein
MKYQGKARDRGKLPPCAAAAGWRAGVNARMPLRFRLAARRHGSGTRQADVGAMLADGPPECPRRPARLGFSRILPSLPPYSHLYILPIYVIPSSLLPLRFMQLSLQLRKAVIDWNAARMTRQEVGKAVPVAPTTIPIGPGLREAMARQRNALGMLQAELGLADMWGGRISVETISKIETGWNKAARLTTLTTLLLRLDIPADHVAGLDGGYPTVTARMRRIALRGGMSAETYAGSLFSSSANQQRSRQVMRAPMRSRHRARHPGVYIGLLGGWA